MPLSRHAPVRALRRSPGLSALMIATLAFGLAVWLTTYGVASSLEQDPMRDVAALWRVELIRHTAIREILRGTDMSFAAELPQVVLSPGEVQELSSSAIPARTAAVTAAELPFQPPGEPPRLAAARFAGRDAFTLFRIRLAAGRVFEEGARELLISEHDARRWFGGSEQALGKMLRVAGEDWHVSGVVAAGAAVGRRMHLANDAADPVLWLPFADAPRLGVLPTGRHAAQGMTPAANGDFDFASLWVELPNAQAVARFRTWLERWSSTHRDAGTPRIRRYQEWSGVLGAPPAYRVFEFLGAVTLAACCLSLAKLFQTRNRLHQRDIALRRALGASRALILRDALVEGAFIAAAGVLAGVVLAAGALQLLDMTMPLQSVSIVLQGSRAAIGAAVGFAAGVAAAVLPAWRASTEPPARGLRAAA